ncbi:MAG: MFS transporter, partial [Rikenellaceae bacterium]
MSQKKVPFRKWVPSWLRAVVGFLILATIMLLNGAYTGSSIDLSSALGVMNEDINMAYYVASAGMATAYPLTSVIRPIVTTKTILLCDLILQVILSLICATTQSIGVIMASSFFIGFLKAFVLLEMIVILKPVFSKRNIRSEFYAYFYPMVFGMGQISLILTAELAYNYKWQYMYYLVMIMLLLSIILVLICFRYGHSPINIPFKDIDRISIFRISTALILIVYV